ncbi:hypothetical protein X797_000197 [Metarhizium robertsii]|uniref:Uncharacterized protein n=1 Tax=Metarhizium robertsii TaxID=568076 RepID=A0A0A1V5I4_9HYPO|nr:hypothetical protein X797_000197 [Metarhizium robertsii]
MWAVLKFLHGAVARHGHRSRSMSFDANGARPWIGRINYYSMFALAAKSCHALPNIIGLSPSTCLKRLVLLSFPRPSPPTLPSQSCTQPLPPPSQQPGPRNPPKTSDVLTNLIPHAAIAPLDASFTAIVSPIPQQSPIPFLRAPLAPILWKQATSALSSCRVHCPVCNPWCQGEPADRLGAAITYPVAQSIYFCGGLQANCLVLGAWAMVRGLFWRLSVQPTTEEEQIAMFDWWERTYNYRSLTLKNEKLKPFYGLLLRLFFEASTQVATETAGLVRHLEAGLVMTYFANKLVKSTDLDDKRCPIGICHYFKIIN